MREAAAEQMQTIRERLRKELCALPDSVKRIRNVVEYQAEFTGFSTGSK